MLVGFDRFQRYRFADFHLRQLASFVVFVSGLLVATFFVDGEKAGEDHRGATGAERGIGATGKVDGYGIEPGRFHLAGDGALPDQLVQFALIVVQILGDVLGPVQRRGRADRFMRLLCVLRFCFVNVHAFR